MADDSRFAVTFAKRFTMEGADRQACIIKDRKDGRAFILIVGDLEQQALVLDALNRLPQEASEE